jgi:hypothetical protein
MNDKCRHNAQKASRHAHGTLSLKRAFEQYHRWECSQAAKDETRHDGADSAH